jgi:tetratricopeptide (TPR) repeat protein
MCAIVLSVPALSGCGGSTIALTYGSEEKAWAQARKEGKQFADEGNYVSAEQSYEEAVVHAQRVQSTNPGHLSETLQDLAEVYEKDGKLPEAKLNYQAALSVSRKMMSNPEASEMYKRVGRICQANAIIGLGRLYTNEKAYDKAMAIYQDGLKIDARADYPAMVTIKHAYADLLDKTGQQPELAKKLRLQAGRAGEGMFEDL